MIQIIASVLLLVICITLTFTLARYGKEWLSGYYYLPPYVVGFTIFFSLFFGCFYILGYINLITNLQVVRPEFAVMLLALVGLTTIFLRGILIRRVGNKTYFLKQQGVSQKANDFTASTLTGWVKLFAIATAVTYVMCGLLLLTEYPHGYEPQAYHLPIAVHFFKSSSLRPWDSAFLHTFPANASIWFGYLMNFLPERLTSIVNVIFLVPLTFAIYGISRTLGANHGASWVSALGTLTIPLVGFSSFEASADIGGLAFLALAVFFTITATPGNFPLAFLGGLAAGIAFGFKSLHLVSISFLAALIFWRAISNPRADLNISQNGILGALKMVATFASGAIIMAGFWLTRNYIEFGNPFYPVQIPVFAELLAWNKAPDIDYTNRLFTQYEWVRSTAEWLIYPWVEWHFIDQNFKHSSGLGAFFATTVPVAMGVAVIRTFTDRDTRKSAVAQLLFGGLFVLGIWFAMGDRQPRYIMGALVFTLPLVGWMLSQIKGDAQKWLEPLIVVSGMLMLIVVISKVAVDVGDRLIVMKQTKRNLYYEYPGAIDHLPANSVIVNLATRTWNFPLFGEGHKNTIVNFVAARRLLNVKDTGDTPPRVVKLSARTLKEKGATHIYAMGDTNLVLDGCIALHAIDSVSKNPYSQRPLASPRILYEINYCDALRNIK